MASPPTEFGKRKPVTAPAAAPPVKRSRHVALLLTGTLAVGGTAYTLMPRENCQPAAAAVAGPTPPISGLTSPPSPTAVTTCGSRYSSGGHGGSSGGWWSRSSFYSGGSSSSSSGSSTASATSETTRGGFGSFAHLFSGGG